MDITVYVDVTLSPLSHMYAFNKVRARFQFGLQWLNVQLVGLSKLLTLRSVIEVFFFSYGSKEKGK